MHYAPVIRIIGMFVALLGLAMAAPIAVDLATGNQDWKVFALAHGTTVFIGVLLIAATAGRRFELERRQGFLLAGGTWIVISAFAALPFIYSEPGMSITDAWFEAVSGLTTTGSTVMTGLGPVVGPAGNFANLPDGAKWVLAVVMLLGRLEYFTLIVMLQPAFWLG